LNKKTLFAYLRRSPFNGLSQDQVNGVEAVLSMPWGDDRFAAYALATVFHETGGTMKPIVENLNYSAAGLRRTFARYFTEREAKEYERKPQAIANRAYGNRMGNGAEKTGDGWKYRGRGYVQITGKNNYATFGIVQNPDEALRPDIAAKVMFEGLFQFRQRRP
jgi:putative chitinase